MKQIIKSGIVKLYFSFLLVMLFACEDATKKKSPTIEDQAFVIQDSYILDSFMITDQNLSIIDQNLIDQKLPTAIPKELSWLELSVTPIKAIYSANDQVTYLVKAFDQFGGQISTQDLRFSKEIRPQASAMIQNNGSEDAGQIQFIADGEVILNFCAQLLENETQKCVQRNFLVSTSKASLSVTEPLRGSALAQNPLHPNHITIKGEVGIPKNHQVKIWVNGVQATLNDAGNFEIDIPVVFGRNDIETIVIDTLSNEKIEDFRSILWAPTYIPTNQTESQVPSALNLALGQGFLDRNEMIDLMANPLILKDLSQTIEVIFALINPLQFLPSQDLINQGFFNLRVEQISLNIPQVQLHWLNDGLELIMDIPDLRITTSGGLNLQGQSISLDGDIQISISAFTRLNLQQGENVLLDLSVQDFGVTVNQITGFFADESANAIVETIGSQLRQIVMDLADDLLSSILQNQLSSILSSGLSSLFSALSHIPINLNPNIPGVAPIALDLNLTPSALELRTDHHARIMTDLKVMRQSQATPLVDIAGIPEFESSDLPTSDQSLSIQLKSSFFNAFAYELWRGNLLTLDFPPPAQISAFVEQIKISAKLPPVIYPTRIDAQNQDRQSPLQLSIIALNVSLKSPNAIDFDHYEISLTVGLDLQLSDDGAFSLFLADRPMMHTALVAYNGNRPILPADNINNLFETLVWPRLKEALDGKISFAIQSIAIDPSQLRSFGLNLESVKISPQLIAPIEVSYDGWIQINGEILFELVR
jgi:hypothetical protein